MILLIQPSTAEKEIKPGLAAWVLALGYGVSRGAGFCRLAGRVSERLVVVPQRPGLLQVSLAAGQVTCFVWFLSFFGCCGWLVVATTSANAFCCVGLVPAETVDLKKLGLLITLA